MNLRVVSKGEQFSVQILKGINWIPIKLNERGTVVENGSIIFSTHREAYEHAEKIKDKLLETSNKDSTETYTHL